MTSKVASHCSECGRKSYRAFDANHMITTAFQCASCGCHSCNYDVADIKED
jgi:hypothetical protein